MNTCGRQRINRTEKHHVWKFGLKMLLIALVLAAGCGGGGGSSCEYHDQFGKSLCKSFGGHSEVGANRYMGSTNYYGGSTNHYVPPPQQRMYYRRMR